MAHEILAATHAVVTLDAALPGIVWPWLVTVNMWAKVLVRVLFLCSFYCLECIRNKLRS